MNERLAFRFEIPRSSIGPFVQLSGPEAEKLLLKKLDESPRDPTKALWQLAQFYKLTKQHDKALARLRQLMFHLPDLEDKADCIFTMGQAMEQVGDYMAAIRYYKEAFALEPAGTFTWYFIHNNLGFCLNALGRFSEGEEYCRRAIAIDPQRPNGYKNLGIALGGLCQHREAAQAFISATQVNAADPRAFHLLEELLKLHPELDYDFHYDVECCRVAVGAVAKKIEEQQPVFYRGWKKQWFLTRVRLHSWFNRLRNYFRGRQRSAESLSARWKKI